MYLFVPFGNIFLFQNPLFFVPLQLWRDKKLMLIGYAFVPVFVFVLYLFSVQVPDNGAMMTEDTTQTEGLKIIDRGKHEDNPKKTNNLT